MKSSVLKLSVAVVTAFLVSACSERPDMSRECAEAAALELSLIKEKSNFPGNSDPVVQKSATEAWTATKRWKDKVCQP